MAVYFIRAGILGPVKIGFAKNISGRLVKMQVDNHEKLIVIGAIQDGDKWREHEVHQTFADLRMQGEWFRPGKKLLTFIGTLPPFTLQISQRASEHASPLGRYMARNGLTAKSFGDLVGVSEFAIGKYVRGERTPRRAVMQKIRAATGGEITADDFTGEIEPDSDHSAHSASQDSAA